MNGHGYKIFFFLNKQSSFVHKQAAPIGISLSNLKIEGRRQ